MLNLISWIASAIGGLLSVVALVVTWGAIPASIMAVIGVIRRRCRWFAIPIYLLLIPIGTFLFRGVFWVLERVAQPDTLSTTLFWGAVFITGLGALFSAGPTLLKEVWQVTNGRSGADSAESARSGSAMGVGIALPVSLGLIILAFYLTRTTYITGVRPNRDAQPENKRSHEYKVSSARVMNGSATMYADTNYFVTFGRGAVGTDGIPELIKLGDRISVKDRSLTVNHILVTEILEDMSYGGKVFARKGEVRCLLMERLEDSPNFDENSNRSRLWINITDCKPLSAVAVARVASSNVAELTDNELNYVFQFPLDWTMKQPPPNHEGDLGEFRVFIQGPRATLTVLIGKIGKSVSEAAYRSNPNSDRLVKSLLDLTVEQYKKISKSLHASRMTVNETKVMLSNKGIRFYITTTHFIDDKPPMIILGTHLLPFDKPYMIVFMMNILVDKRLKEDQKIYDNIFNSFHLIGEQAPALGKNSGEESAVLGNVDGKTLGKVERIDGYGGYKFGMTLGEAEAVTNDDKLVDCEYYGVRKCITQP